MSLTPLISAPSAKCILISIVWVAGTLASVFFMIVIVACSFKLGTSISALIAEVDGAPLGGTSDQATDPTSIAGLCGSERTSTSMAARAGPVASKGLAGVSEGEAIAGDGAAAGAAEAAGVDAGETATSAEFGVGLTRWMTLLAPLGAGSFFSALSLLAKSCGFSRVITATTTMAPANNSPTISPTSNFGLRRCGSRALGAGGRSSTPEGRDGAKASRGGSIIGAGASVAGSAPLAASVGVVGECAARRVGGATTGLAADPSVRTIGGAAGRFGRRGSTIDVRVGATAAGGGGAGRGGGGGATFTAAASGFVGPEISASSRIAAAVRALSSRAMSASESGGSMRRSCPTSAMRARS